MRDEVEVSSENVRTDDEIIRLCRQGRSEGFNLLLDLYQERVYRRAYSFLHNREDALDVTQDVFLRVLKALDRFEAGRPIWPWLRQVTTNACLNRIREESQRPSTSSMKEEWEEVSSLPGDGDPERQAIAAWDRARLERALETLPPLHRMVVILRHREDLSYDEIARALNLPLGTVKTYLFRGRRALREAMERAGVIG